MNNDEIRIWNYFRNDYRNVLNSTSIESITMRLSTINSIKVVCLESSNIHLIRIDNTDSIIYNLN